MRDEGNVQVVRRADVEEREPLARLKTGHVGLSVINLKKSTAFYRSIFEFETIEEVTVGERRFAFLGYDGDTVLTLWQQRSDGFSTDHAGLHHLAFQVDDVATVRGVEATVRASVALLWLDRYRGRRTPPCLFSQGSRGSAFCTTHCTTRYKLWVARFGSAGLSKEFDIVAIPVRGREKRCSRVFPSGIFVYDSAKHIDYDGLIGHGPRLGELLQERRTRLGTAEAAKLGTRRLASGSKTAAIPPASTYRWPAAVTVPAVSHEASDAGRSQSWAGCQCAIFSPTTPATIIARNAAFSTDTDSAPVVIA